MSSPLIMRLINELNYPVASVGSLPSLLADADCLVLFFHGKPERYPESNDVAVILPELIQAFNGRLQAAVVAAEDEAALKERYPFNAWPSLVFLRAGVQVGTISKVQDWCDYLEQIAQFLETPAQADNAIPTVHV